MYIRMAYDDHEPMSLATGLKCDDPTRTQQSFKEESDINTIVERFKITGSVPQNLRMPQSGDFTGIFDYQTAMNALVQTRETFDTLPAKIRARFHNDPQEFYEFCIDEENQEEAIKLGLAKMPEEPVKPEPMEVRVVTDPAAPKAP